MAWHYGMRVHAIRLTPGTDLKAELARVTKQEALRAGFIISCVGSLSQARLRMPGEPESFRTLAEPLEIVSLVGTLCADGPHLHISLSRRDATCVGGHLVSGCIVNTTAEIVIGEAPDIEFSRPTDPATGYAELEVRARLTDRQPAPPSPCGPPAPS
jgi:predicted DNA-binding protein with PD1-like motif